MATIPEQHNSRDAKERFQGGLLYPQKTSDGGSRAEKVCIAHGPSRAWAGLSMFQTAPFVLSGGEVKLLFINPFVRSNNSGTLRMPHLTGPLRRGPGGAQRYRARNDRGARRLSTTSRLRLRAPPRPPRAPPAAPHWSPPGEQPGRSEEGRGAHARNGKWPRACVIERVGTRAPLSACAALTMPTGGLGAA